ncbi:MAG: TIGR03936 family radical SAM-associated protein [Candidatus Nanopelagicales bacterium]
MSRASRDPGREYVAPVMKVRLRYAKRGRLRFSSHRDFQRAFERALRRAGVPMAYSAGFRPHPKISYANAAPTGVASEAEYIEIGLAARFDVDELRVALNEAMPPGLDIEDAVEVREGDLVSRLEASVWQIVLPDVAPSDGERAVDALLAAEQVEVERMMKSGLRRFDARNAVRMAEVSIAPPEQGGCAILTVVVTHGTPSVRPDDVLAALRQVADLVPPVPPQVTRLAQGRLAADARTVSDPLAPDRAGSD